MYLLQLRRRLHIRPLFELCAAATARFEGAGERGIYTSTLYYIAATSVTGQSVDTHRRARVVAG
jgi:hypothetical protein